VTERPKGIASWASSDAVRRSMKSNRSRDTKPELRLRKVVHAQGLRYRVAAPPIPGIRRTADLLFTRAKIAVFVDGCFWHGCPEHHTVAKTNAEFWAQKMEGNRRRDRDTDRLLTERGWLVIRMWEHEAPEATAKIIYDAWVQRTRTEQEPTC
jgi:DNA mismatch endonuclease (patch repair protein)